MVPRSGRSLGAFPSKSSRDGLLAGTEEKSSRERLGEIHAEGGSLDRMCRPSIRGLRSSNPPRRECSSFMLMLQGTDKRIAEVCKRFSEYPFLLTIPGFGPDVSAKVLGAIGDPHRFENHRQVLKMAGLDLSADGAERGVMSPRSSRRRGRPTSAMASTMRQWSPPRETLLS